MRDHTKKWAFVIFRVTVGLNFTFHGINRLTEGLNQFRNWMIGQFDHTFLPRFMVDLFATVLPMFECLIGVLLIFGFMTKYALFCGATLIAILMTGGCILGDWQMVTSQMIYAIAFYLLLSNMQYNSTAIDNLFAD